MHVQRYDSAPNWRHPLASYSQSIFSMHHKGQSAGPQITCNFRQNGSESFEKKIITPTNEVRDKVMFSLLLSVHRVVCL